MAPNPQQAAAVAGAAKSMLRRCAQAHNTKSSSSLLNKIQEKKLLVLDLDETLAHNGSSEEKETCDLSFPEGEPKYYIKYRPHVREFLERTSELFNVVIFTASLKEYADQVLDFLDPEGKWIVGRYYYDKDRDESADGYVKDLRIFGVDLAKVILVDNDPANFRLQENNGIQIKSWYFNPQDEELISTLLPFLEKLAAADDVRPIIIAERFTRSKNEKRAGGKPEKRTEATKKLGNKNKKENVLSGRKNRS